MIKLRSLILNTINIRCIKRMKNNKFGGLGHSAVLRTLPLSGSLNSGYAVRLRSPKPLRASHTRWPLYAIGFGRLK